MAKFGSGKGGAKSGGSGAHSARSNAPSGGGGGARGLRVNVKTAGKRSVSSARWLERQLNDPYVAASKREGYRSRAAYKLLELDDKYRLLKSGQRIVDLGAAPGGWSQIAATRVKSIDGEGGQRGLVVAIDILDMEPLPGVDFLMMDFLAPEAEPRLLLMLGGHKAHGVLTDMAAPTVGHTRTDHLRIMGLAEAAAAFAVTVLEPGGFFLAKVFQGGSEKTMLDLLKQHFRSVRHVKPPASRSDSAELYVLATGYRAGPG
ncbi:MAG: RlmE family RNA methyltransferase [Hyphomicrobiaceae bacterium]|nr:RlmE family RNA methyltransferase [Hyphomicrobiaceae bacterium]